MTGRRFVTAVVLAGGSGERLGSAVAKQFLDLAGRPMLAHALLAFERTPEVTATVVVLPPDRPAFVDHELTTLPKVWSVTDGGPTRQASLGEGLVCLPDESDIVLVHDAARCLAPAELYDAVADHAARHDAVVPGLAVVDTLKQVDDTGRVTATPDRSLLRVVQTPQGFRRSVLERAYAAALERGDTDAPDDASLVERLGLPVHVVPGHVDAFKITRLQDLMLAETVLARRAAAV